MLADAGLLAADGQTRGREYVGSEMLKDLRKFMYEITSSGLNADTFAQAALPFPAQK